MHDNISTALITAFEQHYDTRWDDAQLRNERLAWHAAWNAAQAAPVTPQGVVAWMTPEGDRVVTAETMDGARKDGGASLSSLRPYTVALVRGAAAPALEAPAPAIGPKLARIMGYREHYRTWGRQLSDATELVESHPSHWRIVAEAMDEIADAQAAAPQAPAAPSGTDEVTCVCGATWERHGHCDYEMVHAPRKAAPAAPRVVFADWEMEDRDPVEMLDKIYAVYQRSMGKPAPDAEMAEVVELTKDMLLSWWGEHREDIRAAMVAAQDQAAPAAPAVDASPLLAPETELDAVVRDAEQIIRDAEHYRFIKRHRLILSGGTDTFGWPIAPFGDECDRYIAQELATERAAQAKEGGGA